MLSQVLCLAFDAVGTLIYPDPPVATVYARVGRKYGATLSEREVRERFLRVFRWEYAGLWTTSEFDEYHRWRRVVQYVFNFNDKVLEPCFEELFHHFGQANSWRCFPDVEKTLQTLAARGFDLVLASNFDSRLHAVCQGHPPLASLGTRIISSEAGFLKPHPPFYGALLDKTGFARHEVLMVGDDWTNDIRGALEMGIPAIYLDRSQTEPVTTRDKVKVISSLTQLLELLP